MQRQPRDGCRLLLVDVSLIHTWRLSVAACHHSYLKPTYLRMLGKFPLPKSHPCSEMIVKQPTDDGSYMKMEEKAGSSALRTTKDEGSNAARQCLQASTSAQSKTEHAQLPQQVQEQGPVQQAQHALDAPQAQDAQQAQLPAQLQEHQHAQQAQHAPKAGGLSPVFKAGRKKRCRSCSPTAFSQGAVPSGRASQAAAVGGSPADMSPHHKGKHRAMQKLKALVKKIRPSCMQAYGTGMQSDQQQADVQLQGWSSSETVNDSRHVQLVAAAVDVELVNGKRQVSSRDSSKAPRLSRLRRIFGHKMTMARSCEQPPSEQPRGFGAESEQQSAASSEAGSFLAAIQAPCDSEPQAEVDSKSIAVGGQQAYQS